MRTIGTKLYPRCNLASGERLVPNYTLGVSYLTPYSREHSPQSRKRAIFRSRPPLSLLQVTFSTMLITSTFTL
nr:hypothetical protein Cplu_496 [Cedratvirus plubellavi]